MITNFKKPKGTLERERRKRRAGRVTHERYEKGEVRDRDKRCRFPLCPCKRVGFALHVSHQKHKGMGGNPAGNRSTAAGMVLLCAWRHREGPISIDKGTARWRALSDNGANGPIAWDVDANRVFKDVGTRGPLWMEVAREVDIHCLEVPIGPDSRDILNRLARGVVDNYKNPL